MTEDLKARLQQSRANVVYRWFKDRCNFAKLEKEARGWSAIDQVRSEFYSELLERGDLVFDVGANVGNRSKVFLQVGARVVAFEPQRKCTDLLARVFQNNSRFTLERCALGAQVGETDIYVSAAHTISSLSTEWVQAVRASGRFASHEWNRKERVVVDTLDRAIQRHGRPAFIKIDVEGFEAEVLKGLSSLVPLVSVEFTPELMERTFECIARLAALGRVECQVSLGESMRFALPSWVSEADVRRYLESVDRTEFGDVYIRSMPQ